MQTSIRHLFTFSGATALSLALVAAACSDGGDEPLTPDAGTEPDAGAQAPDAAPDDTPAIVGHWLSPICEARPNGQGGYNYVRRDFTIQAGGTWYGTIDFYADEDCTMPASTASIGGAYEIKAASTRVHGADDAVFHLDDFALTPRADFFVDLLNSAAQGTCGTATWELGVEQDISQTGCSVLGIDHEICPAEHELVYVLGGQLMFGGRPDDGGNLCAEDRRPMTLQTPLVREDGATEARPASEIVGRWTSPICESRPDGNGGFMYLKRDLKMEADLTWTGTFDFYTDQTCTVPVSSVALGGDYSIGPSSPRVHGATEARFEVSITRITPRADFFVDLLDGAPEGTCGADWELGVEQDVSEGGCAILGIDHETCPAEHELVHILGDRLHFGGRPADGGNLCTEERRPITLQTPLLRAE